MPDWLTERYRIDGTVGKGSAATVFRVWDKNDNRAVALKQLTNRDETRYERRVALFRHEYYTLVDLAHPFIIEVYDYGVINGNPYYTMELLEGEELAHMAPVPWRRACSLLRDVASSLAIIHSRRMVHRDLSARNVRCNKNGRAKLLDFGAMVSMGAVKDVVGTAAFMAPEVVYAQPLEGRADLFSLGALAYWLLSGRYAYSARTIQQLKDAWRSAPRSLGQQVEGIPAALDTLVMSMLSLDKLARPVNAAEVIERLTAIARLEQSEVLQVSQAYVTTPSIVGRERELAMFRTRTLSAMKGRGSAVILEGVSGVGRSRLLSSFVLEGKLAGATVLSADGGGAHHGDYGVISSLVERMLEALPEKTLEAAQPEAGILGHVIPSLRAKTREIELIVETDADRLRARIQHALQETFTRVLNRVSLMIAVDDIHLCDESSVAAIAMLARIAPSYPLVLVATLNNDVETRQSRALKALKSSGTSLELQPLGISDSEWLVQSMFGDVANVKIVSDWIYKLSRGNVRTCMELAQHLVDNGIARYQNGNWILPKDLREQKLPQSLRQALQARIDKLSPTALALAESLSLVTEYAPLKLEQYLVLNREMEEKATYSALDELTTAQILSRTGDHFSFSQPGFVDILQRNLSAERQQRIHLKITAAYNSREYHRSLVLIYHEQQAGREVEALEKLIPLIENGELNAEPCSLRVRCYENAYRSIRTARNRKKERFILGISLIELARKHDLSLVKYADPLEQQLYEESGLMYWNKVDNKLDPSRRIHRCMEIAMEKWESTPEEERGLEPKEAVRQMAVYSLLLAAAATPTFDAERIRHASALVAPFRTVYSPAAFIERYLKLSYVQMLGHSVSQTRLEIQRGSRDQIPNLKDERLKEVIDLNPYYLALVEASNAKASAMERADILEQDVRYAAHAWEIRLVAHLYAGRSPQALACLRQKELLAIQIPEADARLLTGMILEAWAYGMSGDLMGLKQVLLPISENAELFPRWVPFMLTVRGNYHLLRGELDQARRDLEKMLEIAPIGQHFAWHRGIPVLVETLLELREFEEARKVASQSLETAKTISPYPEAMRELYRVLALAEAKLGNVEQAYSRIEAVIAEALEERVGGVPLAIIYETAARIAVCDQDVDRFITYAKAVADIYGSGKNPALIAKYAQLMMDAERGQLPGQWRVQNPLETDFLSSQSATRMLQLVHTAMSECITIEQGYEIALQLLVRLTDATHGYLYAVAKTGLRLMAPLRGEPPPAQLNSEVCDYLDSWHANRTDQHPETQTLATRTLSRTEISARSTIITRDQGEYQPLVLWVEHHGQPEVICVAALLALELPLDDLLWPFTSVIAHYLLELQV